MINEKLLKHLISGTVISAKAWLYCSDCSRKIMSLESKVIFF